MSLRKEARLAIDSAISQNVQPKSTREGVGLTLSIPGGRSRVLHNRGGLTAAGQYYYKKSGLPQPSGFDYQQDSIRKGRSQFIRDLSGKQRRISTWDPAGKTWKLTALGKKFYEKAVDRFTVS